jgi:hypothetical protein
MVQNYTATDQSFNQPEINELNSMQLQIPSETPPTQEQNEYTVINSGKCPPLSLQIAPLGVFSGVDGLSPQ